MKPEEKKRLRAKRQTRVRSRVHGDSARPRLNVYRSVQHIYAQVIDDEQGKTLLSASTLDSSLRDKTGGNVEAAKEVGKLIAQRAIEKGIEKVVFDRGGFKYHGRVQALADAAREGGLQF